MYYIHYLDFNKRLDEWVTIDRLDISQPSKVVFPKPELDKKDEKKRKYEEPEASPSSHDSHDSQLFEASPNLTFEQDLQRLRVG